jgi:acetyl-CoA acetyltransferase
MKIAEYLGLDPAVMDGTNIGGSAFVAYLQSAAMAIEMGICEVALIAYGSNNRTGPMSKPREAVAYEDVYQPRHVMNYYAMATARHMHEFGTTREHLAEVAVAARSWARLNPEATRREPLSIAEVLEAPTLVDPLTAHDCCLVSDGGAAAILVSAERARDFPAPPAYLLGIGVATTHDQFLAMPDLTTTAAAKSAPRAYSMAGLGAKDVDVVELDDAFTINTILAMEDLGFCAKGEGGRFVAGGGIAPGGRLPVNTNGGGLSCVHPGQYGLFTITEAVRQLRGQAGERQVKDAQVALCNGNGGVLSSQVTALLGTGATL